MAYRKIGLALGGGAARGWAHIGAIQALHDCGVRPDFVAGTSIGALVGSVYASGNLDSFRDAVLAIDRKRIITMLDVVFPKCGLLDGKKVTDFYRSFISGRYFSDLELEFQATATDLQTSSEVWLGQGEIAKAVRASIAVPGLFTPVLIEDRLMVDGGLVNPLPVNVVRKMGADLVIAVDLNYYLAMRGNNLARKMDCAQKEDARDTESSEGFFPGLMERIDKMDISLLESIRNWRNKPSSPNIFEIIFASTLVMEKTITELRLHREPADILIRPELGDIRFMDFHRGRESVQEGYDACLAALTGNKKIRDMLGITRQMADKLKRNISFQD
ncbi:patatin-like phospholipase family protein [Desulfonatronovibrio hydrogenovorans]|uniref:patatin-like phospholipase family protein n=1 Tax=Desulfonatronovibrio hydrogenovorans TaxID=53245 RepID=UPI00068D0F12|nr:patatin-like phospholipase family protein [Desulfonatronovibrio hydrogenovorans]